MFEVASNGKFKPRRAVSLRTFTRFGFMGTITVLACGIWEDNAAAQIKTEKPCIMSDVRKNWIDKNKEIREANKLLDDLNKKVGAYDLSNFGHDRHSRERKEQLRKEATELFASARKTFDGLIDRISSRTSRACEVCALKSVYEIAVRAKLENVTEDQLEEFTNPDKRSKLEQLMNAHALLSAKEQEQNLSPKASDKWLKLDKEVNFLKDQVRDLKSELIKDVKPVGDKYSDLYDKFKVKDCRP